MIAQPRGMVMTHGVLVRLADPEHPILLTRDDPNSKWGYSLSPDGKYIAYPSEHLKGSSIYLTEVAELIKQVKARKYRCLYPQRTRRRSPWSWTPAAARFRANGDGAMARRPARS
jgi:hypothetical protein